MTTHYYHLNEDGTTTPFRSNVVQDPESFSKEIADAWSRDRTIRRDTIGPFVVSTVFLVLDYAYFYGGTPLLFETMIFGPQGHHLDEYQTRYRSIEEAVEGHEVAASMVRISMKQEKEIADSKAISADRS